MSVKYIFITGGVVSGIGKGITAASLGRLLKSRNLSVTIQKFDPYINIDPGTMSPYQHGEVFVTDDGAETDLDLGHYERFIDENLNTYNSITAGKIYWSVISKERMGKYLGGTVQVIPHITNEIKESVYNVAKENNKNIVITEIGGTVGDIESLPFLEAIRQVACEVGRENCMFIHVTLVPYLSTSGEIKSKPTQHSVKELLGLGIQPDIIVCRTEKRLKKEIKEKIALFCNVSSDCIIQNLDAKSIYHVPLMLEKEGLAEVVCKRLNIKTSEPDFTNWEAIVKRHNSIQSSGKEVKIALVGKYVQLHDAYISISEALVHAGMYNKTGISIEWINSEEVTGENVHELLQNAKGVLVPGGFGDRGIEGKLLAIKYARENNFPYLGICLGMQLAVIEFARNVLGITDANSTELDKKTDNPVIHIMNEQKNIEKIGGTMRLGRFPCKIKENTKTYDVYQKDVIYERHRHRYEFNNKYREEFQNNGMCLSGMSLDGNLIEIVELENHPWFIGVQFHPEFKSRPTKVHPLFTAFVKATMSFE